ncbi:MAG: DUF4012 domain-containing protein [Parcubacteria group bacterium]
MKQSEKGNLRLAMFDIKPVDSSGRIDVGKMQIDSDIDLRSMDTLPITASVVEDEIVMPAPFESVEPRASLVAIQEPEEESKPEPIPPPEPVRPQPREASLTFADHIKNMSPIADSRELIFKEFEESLYNAGDPEIELISMGGAKVDPSTELQNKIDLSEEIKALGSFDPPIKIEPERPVEPKPIDLPKPVVEPKLQAYASPAVLEMDSIIEKYKSGKEFEPQAKFVSHLSPIRTTKRKIRVGRKLGVLLAGIIFVGASYMLVNKGEVVIRQSLEENSESALLNLEYAKANLLELDFLGASENFALAYDDFDAASGTLDKFGASIASALSSLPGFSKVNTASNLVEAGQSISKAGESLSNAFATISETNVFAMLDPSADTGNTSLARIVKDFKESLVSADKNIKKAERLLSDVDTTLIPEGKQEMFLDFRSQIPEFQQYIGGAVDYSDFLLDFIGEKGTKRYILLLQNNTERRATGGFPGTYGIVTFEDGYLKEVFINDIYLIDGQIKQNIIPPEPLAHITANWGMRDANWFADFPTSAKKVEEMYMLDGGGEVDGVLAVTPYVIERLLDIVGPIEMPEYNVTLTSENFLDEIQNEVEYEADRSAPKQIVSDFQPKFMEALAEQEGMEWVEIFKILLESVEQKHVLAYFDNSHLQETAEINKFSGEVIDVPHDYIQVVISNIKGAKTDAVTENAYQLDSVLNEDGSVEHTLIINRVHNGGHSKYGFYNQTNNAYIRVYVPENAQIISAKDVTSNDHEPLVDYDALGFKMDPDLAEIEDSKTSPIEDLEVFTESGKRVFGFWLDTEPQDSSVASITYKIPNALENSKDYRLLWQKQSGSVADNMHVTLRLPDGRHVLNVSPNVQSIGNNLIYQSDLSIDRGISITLN